LVGKRNADQQVDAEGMCLGMPRPTSAYRRLVGKSQSRLLVCRGKMSVGKEISVGKENVGRERFTCGVELLVGKYMSVGKGLCRPDLQ
jgi:hypothetical protein